jgi:hypothetical protein
MSENDRKEAPWPPSSSGGKGREPFLCYVIESVLGPPKDVGDPGEMVWDCPLCGHDLFHTLPDKPPMKHRFRCGVCTFRGDAWDFLVGLYPHQRCRELRKRLGDAWVKGLCPHSQKEKGTTGPRVVDLLKPSYDRLTLEEREALVIAARIHKELVGVPLVALAEYCQMMSEAMEHWKERMRKPEAERKPVHFNGEVEPV